MLYVYFTPANQELEGHLESVEFRINVCECVFSTPSKRSGEKNLQSLQTTHYIIAEIDPHFPKGERVNVLSIIR